MFYSWVVPTACGTTSTSDGDDHEILSTAGDDVESATAAATAATGRDDNIVDWESTMAEASSIEIDELLTPLHDDEDSFVKCEGEGEDYVDEEEEYNPIGLQIWPNGKTTR